MAMEAYTGGCQCGAVRYRATVDLDQTVTCNCSRCGRLGTILAFAPADNFELVSGADAQTEYRFNTGKIVHLFCTTCGVESFARGEMPDGTPTVAINARCLDEIDPDLLVPQKIDGRSF